MVANVSTYKHYHQIYVLNELNESTTPNKFAEFCLQLQYQKAREWATSKESMQSASSMCKNIIDGIEETFAKWKPRKKHELIKVEKIQRKKALHKLVY